MQQEEVVGADSFPTVLQRADLATQFARNVGGIRIDSRLAVPRLEQVAQYPRFVADRVPPRVAGRQLVDVGIDGGPWVGEALKKTRDAMVDGKITEDEALEYALACARRIQRGCRS